MKWRNVVGYDGLYEVSSNGVVRSLPRVCHKMEGKVLKEYIYLGKRNLQEGTYGTIYRNRHRNTHRSCSVG